MVIREHGRTENVMKGGKNIRTSVARISFFFFSSNFAHVRKRVYLYRAKYFQLFFSFSSTLRTKCYTMDLRTRCQYFHVDMEIPRMQFARRGMEHREKNISYFYMHASEHFVKSSTEILTTILQKSVKNQSASIKIK